MIKGSWKGPLANAPRRTQFTWLYTFIRIRCPLTSGKLHGNLPIWSGRERSAAWLEGRARHHVSPGAELRPQRREDRAGHQQQTRGQVHLQRHRHHIWQRGTRPLRADGKPQRLMGIRSRRCVQRYECDDGSGTWSWRAAEGGLETKEDD